MLRILDIKIKSIVALRIIRQGYHIYDIMHGHFKENYVKIDSRAINLYVDKYLKSPFNQKEMSGLLVDTERTKQSLQTFLKVLNYAVANLKQIHSFLTISTMMNQIFVEGYNDQQVIKLIAQRGFQIIPLMNKKYHFQAQFRMRFIISIEKLVGLGFFTNQQYQLLQCSNFKPLFISFVIELFFKHNLANQYPFINNLIKKFIFFEKYVPLMDVHHLNFFKRVVAANVQLIECINRIQKNVSTLSQASKIKQASPLSSNSTIKFQINWQEFFHQEIINKYQ